MYQGLVEIAETLEESPRVTIGDRTVEERISFNLPENSPPLEHGELLLDATIGHVSRSRTTNGETGESVEFISVMYLDPKKNRSRHFGTSPHADYSLEDLPDYFRKIALAVLEGSGKNIEQSTVPPIDLREVTVTIPWLELEIDGIRASYRDVAILEIEPGKTTEKRFALYDSLGRWIATPLEQVEGLGGEYLAVSQGFGPLYVALIGSWLAQDAGYKWKGKRVVEALEPLRMLTGVGFYSGDSSLSSID